MFHEKYVSFYRKIFVGPVVVGGELPDFQLLSYFLADHKSVIQRILSEIEAIEKGEMDNSGDYFLGYNLGILVFDKFQANFEAFENQIGMKSFILPISEFREILCEWQAFINESIWKIIATSPDGWSEDRIQSVIMNQNAINAIKSKTFSDYTSNQASDSEKTWASGVTDQTMYPKK